MPAKNNQETDWRTQFLDYLTQERRYSEHTISAYQSDLDQFQASLGRGLLSASTADIRKFILDCLESGASPKTARRKLSAIRSFLQFVFGEGGIDLDPSRHIRAPKAFDMVIRPITRPEVDQILESLDSARPLDLRNRALMFTAYGSGLRVSEAASLKIADVDLEKGVAKVRRGKGQKDRWVPLSPPEIGAIRLYLEKARPGFAQDPDNGTLFIGIRGEPLTRQRVWQVLTRISKRIVGLLGPN